MSCRLSSASVPVVVLVPCALDILGIMHDIDIRACLNAMHAGGLK